MKFISKKFVNSKAMSVVIVFVLLAAANFLALQKAFYIDLTEGKIYTVSDAAKDVLKNLNKDINVNFYISKDLPADLENAKTQIKDFMNQYKSMEGGERIKLSYNDPENSKEKIDELAKKGIPQIQFNVIEKDKYEVKNGFFGVEISAGEGDSLKREVIPIIGAIENWEYDFISAVYSVSKDDKETIAFLKGHNEKDLQISDLSKSYNVLYVKTEYKGEKKGFFDIADVSNDENEEKEKTFVNPITLIISGPASDFPEEEIGVIDEYIKSGGNVIVLSEAVNPDFNNNLQPKVVENNINLLIEKYGIKINSDLVYDVSNSNITYRQGFFSLSRPYPLWVKAVRENFGDNPSLYNIQSVVFPWASSLSISDVENYKTNRIISSTSKAGKMSESYNLMPNAKFDFSNTSQKVLAAVSTPKNENSKGSLFVVGDSDFVSSDFTNQVPDNKVFFMNFIDSVSNSVNLSSIRSKNITDRPIKELNESEKNYWKFAVIFASAIIVDIYGVFRILRRKKRQTV